MRHTPWLTTAILMFGCAQGNPGGDPPVDVAAGATTPAAGGAAFPADAGTSGAAGPCDSAIDAAAGTSISATRACPGLLPPAVRCAAGLRICSGAAPGSGNAVGWATSDGRGSAVLSCQRFDVGPPALNFLFVPKPSGFVSKAQLGEDVRPLADGFVSSAISAFSPPPGYDFLAHDGDLRAAQRGGVLYASADRAVIVPPEDPARLVAQTFHADGTPLGTAILGTLSPPAGSVMLGGATNPAGATLVLWQIYGETTASARWIAPDGTLATPTFAIGGWTDSAPLTAPLAGGSVAVAAQPDSGEIGRRWRGVIAPGETTERPAPGWLAARGDFRLLPAGKAMAFGNEIVTGDGTVCGTVDLGAQLVGIGVDGTAFTARSATTFRLYPQLFR